MYLKSLELYGFKSFTDKTRLEFGPGISVIVGPNGSGKSNVADAIRWVLGEQSAKSLRGTKMEDIIFAGTKNRKPLGMAEVSMVLDNTDGSLPLEFSEVTVTRRTYRSGEGEFLINHSPCRLKDIHNMFVDTGVGADGFTIVGQGRVEEILNCRPEERRGLIEETAGIVKYRNRKKEAVRKLEETEKSLERIRDIILELSSQVEPLREQAEKARSYQQLRSEADELEISLAVHNMEEIKLRLEEALRQTEEKSLELIRVQARQGKLESQVENLKLDVNRLDEEISLKQQEFFQISGSVEQKEAEIKLTGAKKEAAAIQVSRLMGELKELVEKKTGLEAALAGEKEKQNQLVREVQSEKEVLAAREDIRKETTENLEEMEKRLESLKTGAFDLVQAMADLRNEINSQSRQIYSLDQISGKLSHQEQDFSQYLVSLAEKEQCLSERIKQVLGELREVQEALRILDETLGRLKVSEKGLQAEEARRREISGSLRSRLELLLEMEKDYDGYYPGVKAVLLGKRKNQPACLDVVGVLAELIQVPDRYRVAVETALGGALQNLVTLTDNGAKEAIEFLKKNRGGRATFLPLNIMKPSQGRDLSAKLKDISGAAGLAADLVTCSEQVRPAVDFLLKRVVVVDNMDTALHVARRLGFQAKIVTLEGDIINPGGVLTGGSRQKKTTSLLARAGEISSLKKQLAEQENQHQEISVRLQEVDRELEKVKGKKEDRLDRLRELEILSAGAQKELVQLEEAKETARKNIALVQAELVENQKARDAAEKQQMILTGELADMENRKENLAKELAALEEEIKEVKENLSGCGDGLTEIKVRLARLVQEETSVRHNVNRLEEERNRILLAVENKEQEKESYQKDQKQKEEEIIGLKEEVLLLVQSRKETEDSLNRKKHDRSAGAQELADKEREAGATAKLLVTVQQESHQAELKKDRLEMEWNKYLEKLQEKFRLDFIEAQQRKKEITSKRATAQRISEIEKEIDRLGPVNLTAIEEYIRVKERYEFLESQRVDLEEARQSLFGVIEEMDRIMIRRFRETFQEVNKQFNGTFAHLFGGGVAELILTDQENILETGIEIIVQPPGKKLQHHNLLSGGEKSLTGIALMFAILKVRPSPFCVVDEIEAALDEVNVDRFASYMKEFAAKTQFIVVSHRQGTMEVADVLYGITMEENGISKTVSVKLAG